LEIEDRKLTPTIATFLIRLVKPSGWCFAYCVAMLTTGGVDIFEDVNEEIFLDFARLYIWFQREDRRVALIFIASVEESGFWAKLRVVCSS
jgi:hypothetical protein